MPMIHPVILSGGTGSRLWPLSRSLFPKQLLALAGRQGHPFPATASWRPVPQIDGNVVYAALHNPDKLGLGCGGQLEVQAPDGSLAFGIRLIVLNEPGRDSGRRERPLVVGFGEIPAGIRKTTWFQQLKAGQAEISDVHHLNEPAKRLRVKSCVSTSRCSKNYVDSTGYERDRNPAQLRGIPEYHRKIVALRLDPKY